MSAGNDENWITDLDRQIADGVAEQFGGEPDYEDSAQTRRELESDMLSVRVYGLSYCGASALRLADRFESYATECDKLTSLAVHLLSELRRLVWSRVDDNEILDAIEAAFNATHGVAS